MLSSKPVLTGLLIALAGCNPAWFAAPYKPPSEKGVWTGKVEMVVLNPDNYKAEPKSAFAVRVENGPDLKHKDVEGISVEVVGNVAVLADRQGRLPRNTKVDVGDHVKVFGLMEVRPVKDDKGWDWHGPKSLTLRVDKIEIAD